MSKSKLLKELRCLRELYCETKDEEEKTRLLIKSRELEILLSPLCDAALLKREMLEKDLMLILLNEF